MQTTDIGINMAFGIGTSTNTAKWFDYKKDGDKQQRVKIKSANNELYLAKNEEAGILYRAQPDDEIKTISLLSIQSRSIFN
ncbi:hypothetical protein HADU_06569 [Acinetobacter sp. HA]|uniref:hypothetical protein n=1 Tax=Acinetobacter sp. HA TaxID=1173062 RepID=UPI000263E690|nr:hypothetical protein [Acinetobacter sp. HA]EIM39489.1 hypothetical protein HADU_06569 [Acinetobacter sp. HA]